MSEAFEASEQSGIRTVSSYSLVSSDSTTPLSPDHPLTYVSPTPTPARVLFHRRTARMVRYRSSYETPSSSSLILPTQKRYRGTSKLILDTDSKGDELREEDIEEGLEDESSDADDEREGQGLDDEGQGLDDEDTATSEPLDLGYEAARCCALESTKEIAPSTYETSPSPEWSSGSLPISPSSPVVPSPITLPVATPTATILVDEDQFLEAGGEIISQRFTFKSLEREQKRATVAFGALWRLVLALEAWAGHVDTRMTNMSWAGYDHHRLIHDMLVQQALRSMSFRR
uniref:Uncharacterized protein n=1 Tax=Tanacetum cinerariifolium TaxID=118510 RepID=A0A699IR94_TANCI|nr:hypothetical protein [Tanacetum cinerariifolium]